MNPSDDRESMRAAYDQSVSRYLETVGTETSDRFETAADMALVDDFAQQLRRGRVLDVGCGPGRLASRLHQLGLDVAGVDLSPEMVRAARDAHPDIEFSVGSLDSLPVADGELSGAVYWYSIINTAPDLLEAVWAESIRALRADGSVLVAFQAGDGDVVTLPRAYGSNATLTLYRL